MADSPRTQVVVVGAGPAGLTLANLLHGKGITCLVLEEQSRAFIEQRPRAGFIEEWAVRALERHGLADRPEVVAMSKSELPDGEEVRERLAAATGVDVLAFSSVTGQGLDRLLQRAHAELLSARPAN